MAANTASVDALLNALYRSPLGGVAPTPVSPISIAPFLASQGNQGEGGPRGMIGQHVMQLPSGGGGGGSRGTPALASALSAFGGGVNAGFDALKSHQAASALADAYGAGSLPAFPSFDISGPSVGGGPSLASQDAAQDAAQDAGGLSSVGAATETPIFAQPGKDMGGAGGIAALRYNNPGNVSLPIAGWDRGGEIVGLKDQPGYAKFPDMQTGMDAFKHRVENYIDSRGLNTIGALNSVYATDPHWSAGVARAAGLGVDTPLDTSNPEQMRALQTGILTQEMGAPNAARVLSALQLSPGAPARVQLAGPAPTSDTTTPTPPPRPDMAAVPVPMSGPYGAPASTLGGPVQAGTYNGQPYTYQTQPAINNAPPIPSLAKGLAGGAPIGSAGTVPDGQGGYVPATNSRVGPGGSLLPAQALARGLDPNIAPAAAPPQPAQTVPPGRAAPISPDVAATGQPVPPSGAAPAAAPAIVVPGYEAKGPLTRAQVAAAPDSDNSMPAEEDWDAAARAQGMPAASATAAPSGQAPAQAAAAPAAPVTDQRPAFLQREYATASQGQAKMIALAQQAMRSWPPQPQVAAQYMQQANAYRAVGEHIRDELYKTIPAPPSTVQPGQHVLTQQGQYYVPVPAENTTRLATAADMPAGSPPDAYKGYQIKDGELEPIKPVKAADTTEIQNYKFDQENRQAQGLPPISFSEWNTQKTMYGKAERPLVDVTGKEIDPSVTGDELFKLLPPAVANHAQAIAEIRERWPSGTEQARQPQLQQALAAAQQLDPSLNQTSYQTRQSMKNSAESGSGRINVANLANNTALFHSSTLADAIVALNNSNNTILNATVNSGAGPAGGIIPGATNKADDVKQFAVARDAVANELERSFHGVGTTAEQAVARQIADLSVNDAPQTQLGALKKAQELLQGKIEANEADYKDTMGDRYIAAWERDHGRPFGFITPAAQAAGDRVAAMYESVKAGKGFHGFEQPSAGAQTQVSAPAPTAGPSAPPQTSAPASRKGVYVPGQGIQWQ